MNKEFFAHKEVLVMGLGRFGGGADTAEFMAKAGAKLVVTDLASKNDLADSVEQLKNFPIEFHLNGHCRTDFEKTDIVIANPAVPADNEFLKIAERAGKVITSQINIFFQLCPATIIAITGSNGKSTTAALTAHLLESAKRSQTTRYENVWLSGNIGNEPLLTNLDKISTGDLVVLELSSFQTENLAQLKKGPNVALLTNLTPNHLDRHGTFTDYCDAKENIFKYQPLSDKLPAISFFNSADDIAASWFDKYKNDKGRVCVKFSADDVPTEVRTNFNLPGRVNISNLAAAMAIARGFGVADKSVTAALLTFKSLPHRLEFVAEIDGVRWYNDSIATTPQSAIAALRAFAEPKIIIAGGYDKSISFDDLGSAIDQTAKAAILIGRTAEKIASSIRDVKIEFADSLARAVSSAERLAVPGDVVLLSPACASYDMFDNFQQRGRQFTELVQNLRTCK